MYVAAPCLLYRPVCLYFAVVRHHLLPSPFLQSPVFQAANPGLALDYQFIDVPDFKGRGESEPAPYYYQNLGEAE